MKVLLGSFSSQRSTLGTRRALRLPKVQVFVVFCMDWVTVSSSVLLLQSKNSERLFFSTVLKWTTMADTGSFTCDFARRRRPFARSAAKTVKIFEDRRLMGRKGYFHLFHLQVLALTGVCRRAIRNFWINNEELCDLWTKMRYIFQALKSSLCTLWLQNTTVLKQL